MIICKLAICGEKLIRDADFTRISVIDIYEDYFVPGFPIAIPNVEALFILSRELNDNPRQEMKLDIVLDEQTLNTLPVSVDFKESPVNRIVFRMSGLFVSKPGSLYFRLMHAERKIGEYSFRISQVISSPEIQQSLPRTTTPILEPVVQG